MAVESKYFVDVFGAIVDSMRQTGTITASSEISTGVYTITTSNALKEYWHVTIDGTKYEITSVTGTTFNIQATTGLDFTDESWKALEPYYMYGHPVEIANRLSIKSRQSTKYEKYPLVVLMTDFEEDHSLDDVRYDYSVDPVVLIVESTKKNYISEQRMEYVFKPTLYPLYNTLLEKVDRSPYLTTIDEYLINHSKYDRLYWGVESTNGNTGLVFNDHLDAIELNFNDLIVVKDNNICQ